MTRQLTDPPALTQNLELLQQGIALLDGLPDHLYAEPDGNQPGFREVPGPHLRHCIDAYHCLLNGLDAGLVDYDARSRSRDVETSRAAALAAFGELKRLLEQIEFSPDHALQVLVDVPANCEYQPTASTLGREYQFLVGHTIHHYALVALILRRRGFEPGAAFGVAPSTLEFWRQAGDSKSSR